MNDSNSQRLALARRAAAVFSDFSNVEAIGLAGSQAAGTADPDSDIDLNVYITSVIPLSDRVAAIEKLGAARLDLHQPFWGLSDEWCDEKTGIEVDVSYWDPSWMEGQLERVLVEHQSSVGYSTCFWHTVRNSQILYDKSGWLARLKEKSLVPFPEGLRQAIIVKNHPVLRNVISSYRHQVEKAIRRNDSVSLNHRVSAFMESYFDVLFALNRLPNPGEKRLLRTASESCARIPEDMVSQVEGVLSAVSLAGQTLVVSIDKLVDSLDQLMEEEGFDPKTSLPRAS